MKKTAKLISLLLSALLVLTAMPISAFAEGEAAEKTNLALGKSYTKSVESDMGGGYVDSNGTELTDGVVGPADVSAGEWTVISQAFDVVVDLGANCVFDTFEVVVPTHLSTIALMPMNVAIAYGDTADGEFTEVYNDAIADPGAAKVETLTVTPGEEYEGRFVKFSFSGGAAGWNPVGELRVFGEYKEADLGEPDVSEIGNLALNKTYTKSVAPTAGGDYMDAVRTDTDDAELTNGVIPAPDYWNEAGWVHWIGSAPEITVDLGGYKGFDTFEVTALSHFSADGFILPANVKISVSADGTAWEEIDTVAFPTNAEVTTPTSYTLTYALEENVAGQYVKFSFPAGWNLIGELKVINTKVGDPETPIVDEEGNVALGKTYEKSVAPSAGGDYMDAIRMDTDDAELTNGIVPAPDYWNEAGWVHWIGKGVEITVDLENRHVFDEAQIVLMTHVDSMVILPPNVKIAISDDKATWNEIDDATLPEAGATAEAYVHSYKSEEKLTARYVKFTLPEGYWNLVSEISVINNVEEPEEPFYAPELTFADRVLTLTKNSAEAVKVGVAYIGDATFEVGVDGWNEFVALGKAEPSNGAAGYVVYADFTERSFKTVGNYVAFVKYTDFDGVTHSDYSVFTIVDSEKTEYTLEVIDYKFTMTAPDDFAYRMGVAYIGDAEFDATAGNWEDFIAKGQANENMNGASGYVLYVNSCPTKTYKTPGNYAAFVKYFDSYGNTIVDYYVFNIPVFGAPKLVFDNVNTLNLEMNEADTVKVGVAYIGNETFDAEAGNWDEFVALGKAQGSKNGASGYVLYNNITEDRVIKTYGTLGNYAAFVKYTNNFGTTKADYMTFTVA